MTKRTVRATPLDVELRQFCVEMAAKWPSDHYGNGMMGGYSPPTECDLIGRAQRIYDWIYK